MLKTKFLDTLWEGLIRKMDGSYAIIQQAGICPKDK